MSITKHANLNLVINVLVALMLTVDFIWIIKTLHSVRAIDLDVYRLAGENIIHGSPIYVVDNPQVLPFIYSPFAALVFVPLALTGNYTSIIWTILGLTALARSVHLVVNKTRVQEILREYVSQRQLVFISFSLFLFMAPSRWTISLGQINFFILWLVAESFLGSKKAYIRPLSSAIATGIKLVTGVFSFFFFLFCSAKDRWILIGSFTITIGIGFAVRFDESKNYWTSYVFDPGRFSPEYLPNASLKGVLARTIDDLRVATISWMILSAVILAVGCYVVYRLLQLEEQLWAISMIAITTLLVSPISWVHHFVFMLFPLLALLADSLKNRIAGTLLIFSCLLLFISTKIYSYVAATIGESSSASAIPSNVDHSYSAIELVASSHLALMALSIFGYGIQNYLRLRAPLTSKH